MSVVIAIREEGKVYLGADTMVTYGDSKRHLRNAATQKIWAVEDTPNCIMGGVGSLRDINLVHYCTENLVPEINILKDNINIGTIMMNAVPVIFGAIRDYAQIAEVEETPVSSCFIWAHGDKAFTIFNDGSVEYIEDYEAIGSGADAALASLAHTEGLPAIERMFLALEAASDINLYVARPYVIIDTENCELGSLTNDCDDDDEDDEDEDDDASDNTDANLDNEKVAK